MKNTNINIRKLIKEEILRFYKIINENDDNLPPGANYDPRAPWNDDDLSIASAAPDYKNQIFNVIISNGEKFQLDFIDVLEMYWAKNPNSYEQQMDIFPDRDETVDAKIIQYLIEKGEKNILDRYIFEIGQSNELFGQPNDPWDHDFEED